MHIHLLFSVAFLSLVRMNHADDYGWGEVINFKLELHYVRHNVTLCFFVLFFSNILYSVQKSILYRTSI